MFGDVVLGIPHDDFEAAIRQIKADAGVTFDIELGAQHLKQLVEEYKKVWKCDQGTIFVDNSRNTWVC